MKVYKKSFWQEIKAANWKLFVEMYYEILLAATLGFLSLFEGTDKFFGSDKYYDFVCSLLTVIFMGLSLIFPIWVTNVILKTQKSKSNKLRIKYESFFSDVSLKSKLTALFHAFVLYRKKITVFMLIFLSEWPTTTFVIFIVLQTVYFAQLYETNPFFEKSLRDTEIYDIIAILLCVHISNAFSYTDIAVSSRDVLGWVLMSTCGLIIFLNILAAVWS